nr:NYN domain-containing protein [Mycobacterium sp. KBS0706]
MPIEVPAMADENRLPRFAILIDADNTSPRIAAGLFEEVAKFGEASVRRIYGDFSSQRLKSWADILQKYAIDPYQQFAYTTGKNASDITLVIDAMDLLHSGRFDGFCLVSSDSDFTRLASRLREQGADVYGFGEQKTPESFRQACRRFIYTENLLSEAEVSAPEEGPSAKALWPPAKAHSRPDEGRRAAGGGGRLGWIGRGGAAPREHRLRLRSAHLWLSQAQRSGPTDRGVRHRPAGRQGPAGQDKTDATA